MTVLGMENGQAGGTPTTQPLQVCPEQLCSLLPTDEIRHP